MADDGLFQLADGRLEQWVKAVMVMTFGELVTKYWAIFTIGVNRMDQPTGSFRLSNRFQQYQSIRGKWNGPFHMLPLRGTDTRPSRCR